ncbi:Metallo-hydrolase/oxidoreductase [Annulohypoxylon bovei var. microspora]|nr:Metallo-hydrolase/oxidoreductase [Annulohypoxylon bovei var. microspora]
MSELRSAVYVAAPIPIQGPSPKAKGGIWSPISCTLIYSSKEAVLVDTPITMKQTEELIVWIEKIAPNRKLSYIYITHGHGDHFFGIPVLLKRFPEAIPLATAATVSHMRQQTEEKFYNATWESRFPGQIYRPFTMAQELPASNQFKFEDHWLFQAVECGHSDTHDSTILWVPDLKLAVCGDVVYGQVHQMLAEANTKSKREEWIKAIEKVKALGPNYVVPGHKQAGEIDGVWHLDSTKKYIEDFGKVLESRPKNEAELFTRMRALYPDRFNPGALKLGTMAAFPREHRI